MINIQKLIKESSLSDLELGRLSDIPRETIWKIRKGKVDPRLSTVNKILEVFDNKKAST